MNLQFTISQAKVPKLRSNLGIASFKKKFKDSLAASAGLVSVGLWMLPKKVLAQAEFTKLLPKLGDNCNPPARCDPNQIQSLGELFLYLFNLGLWIVGIALFVQVAIAGLEWLGAGPNITKVQSAKERLTNSALGFILLLSAWLILKVINPDLVGSQIQLPGIQ